MAGDYYEDSEDRTDEIVDALRDVKLALHDIEKAVKDKWTSIHYIFAGLALFGFWSLLMDAWHAKWRFALFNGVEMKDVYVDHYPHDCAFATAPVGAKFCHYEREVSTVQWATSTTGDPIASYDQGKTWSQFTPDKGAIVPRQQTVVAVHITWKRIDDDD